MTIAQKTKLTSGLYLIATPIGNARDVSLRALDLLTSADVLAAEDTRSLRRLMEIHGIAVGERPLVAYHEHNGAKMRPRLLANIADGKTVLYASEAGTPLISDPGFDLVRAAREEGLAVTSAPGATAAVTALSISGLPTDRFMFAGFLPNAKAARRRALEALSDTEATLVFYESPKRLGAMLADAATSLGGDRKGAVCRELTKRFEEVRTGTLEELAAIYSEENARGEIVVLIEKGVAQELEREDVEALLNEALATHSVRDAAELVAKSSGWPKRKVYQLALHLND